MTTAEAAEKAKANNDDEEKEREEEEDDEEWEEEEWEEEEQVKTKEHKMKVEEEEVKVKEEEVKVKEEDVAEDEEEEEEEEEGEWEEEEEVDAEEEEVDAEEEEVDVEEEEEEEEEYDDDEEEESAEAPESAAPLADGFQEETALVEMAAERAELTRMCSNGCGNWPNDRRLFLAETESAQQEELNRLRDIHKRLTSALQKLNPAALRGLKQVLDLGRGGVSVVRVRAQSCLLTPTYVHSHPYINSCTYTHARIIQAGLR